jgi:glycosyltransferase involved in cell wall biosynthesis
MAWLKILYVQYTNPGGYPPLEHSSRILANDGWQVLFFGTGARGADALAFPRHPNIEVRRWKFCSPGIRQKLHYIAFGLWCLWTALTWRPKWIYASDPLSCPIALLLKLFGFRVLYHEHDSPSAVVGGPSSVVRRQWSFDSVLLRCRTALARRAEFCVLPNQRRIQAFREQTGRVAETLCVWNCPSRAEAIVVPKNPTDKFIVFYHGSIVPSRLPLTVIEALAQLPSEVELHVAGYETVGAAGYIAELERAAARLGISSRVKYLGALSRGDLLPRTREAHVGLALMPVCSDDINMTAMTGASNKPFEYLACGLALLVSDLPEWHKLFVESGYGRACDPGNASDVASALNAFLQDSAATAKMGRDGCERIAREWNYETQFRDVQKSLAPQ